MIGLKIDKANFFDRTKVIEAIGKAEAKNQAKAAGLVRTTARRSMRRKKGPSPAGSPPHTHEGTLRDRVYFAYEPQKRNTVIGPEGIGGSDTPEALEHGGRFTRRVRPGFKSRKGRKSTPRQVETFKRKLAANSLKKKPPTVTIPVNYEPRPFMGPALEKSQQRIAEIWGNSVKP